MLSIRPLQLLPSMSWLKQPRACYIPFKKLLKKNMKLMEEDKKILRESGDNLPEFLDEMEQFESKFGRGPAAFLDENKRNWKQSQRYVKHKIIEKKLFKAPQEVNLLTWDAKEQIRYLNYEFPEEWTLEKLSESFPISVDGLRKLLKSKYVPRGATDLYKHDLRVKDNWKALKAGATDAGGPLAIHYQDIVSQGKMRLLPHAAGNASLPMPEKTLLGSCENIEPKEKAVGRFEAIVKDYVEKTNMKTKHLDSGDAVKTDIINQTDDIKKLLQSFLPSDSKKGIVNHVSMFKFLQDKSARAQEPPNSVFQAQNKLSVQQRPHDFRHSARTKESLVSQDKRIDYVGDIESMVQKQTHQEIVHEVCDIGVDNLQSPSALNLGSSNEPPKLSLPVRRRAKTFDEFQLENSRFPSAEAVVLAADPIVETDDQASKRRSVRPGRTVRRGRGRSDTRVQLSDLNSDDILKYQMEGTKKLQKPVANEKGDMSNRQSDSFYTHGAVPEDELNELKDFNPDQSAKGSFEQLDKEVISQLKFDRKDRDTGESREPYLYSDEKGYQHPYGKTDGALNPINVSEKMKKPGRIFKRGDVYYDEGGEFLYRTP